MLAQAKDDFKHGQYLSCLDHCEILGSAYKEFPEGKEGVQLGNDIKNNKERMAKVAESLSDRLAGIYLTLAETYKNEGKKELAADFYERVKKLCPDKPAALTAQVKLNEIQGKPNQPAMFEKP